MTILSLTPVVLEVADARVASLTLTFLEDGEYEFVGGGGAPVNSL